MTTGRYDKYDGDGDGDLSETETENIISNLYNSNKELDELFDVWSTKDIETGPGGNWSTTIIPEPATFILFGLGLFGWTWLNRRKYVNDPS